MTTCKIHGLLKEEDVMKGGVERSGKQRLRCKLCFKKTRDTNYEKNKHRILLANKKWREENPEKRRLSKRESYNKNKHKYQAWLSENWKADRESHRDRWAEYNKKRVNELYDSYIIDLLRRGTTLTPEEIPKQLIEFKKALVMLRRKLRKLNGEGKEPEST
jgi:hypothetical protein